MTSHIVKCASHGKHIIYDVTRGEIESALERVKQLGQESNQDDIALLRAWIAGMFTLLETVEYGSDETSFPLPGQTSGE